MNTFTLRSVCLVVSLLVVGAAQDPDPCSLLTAAEVESATGLKVASFAKSPGTAAFCVGQAQTATVMLRFGKKSGAAGREAQGIEQIKKVGAKIDVKTFGPITCSAITPPEALASQIGFNTTCSVSKDQGVAAIEITVKAQKDAIPIEKLRPLAEKMATRF